MPHDGQTPAASPLLPDLIPLTAAALPDVAALLVAGRQALAARVCAGGRVDAPALETHQHAAHALAWFATYHAALQALQDWGTGLQSEGAFGDALALAPSQVQRN